MEVVDISEAAQRLGISVHAVRRRLYRGQLQGRKEKTGRWLVVLEEGMRGPLAGTGEELEDEGEETSPGEVAVLRELVDTLQTQLATLQQHLDSQAALFEKQLTSQAATFQTQLDRQHGELEARRREVAELHVLLQQAQRQLPAPQGDGQAPAGSRRRRFWPWGGKT
jgi:hypothetical protein